MSTKVQDLIFGGFPLLRYEPTEMRVRVRDGELLVADTVRAMLVWEPRRIVPSYAVPVADLRAGLTASSLPSIPAPDRILDPGTPFAAHSCPGEAVDLVVGRTRFAGAGFRPEDTELASYLVLDFRAFEEWYGEDDRLFAHPRDPYHRVDVRPSSRTVRIEADGVLLAESNHPVLVFETSLPTRYYVPLDDVVAELTPSERTSECAYKGRASYFSTAGYRDLAWTYPAPLDGATPLAGLVAFLDDKLDVFIDGEPRRALSAPAAGLFNDRFGLKHDA
ncbi:DUF427 domain-containing protein [Kribbella sp. NPDC051770]|uniref:DUF427 domain-containing protein n=1 Tax=Kribbella sp. NPDC051770 TaxID=3155413 RepID=UPI00342C6D80